MFINIPNSRLSLRKLAQLYYPVSSVDSMVKLIISINRLSSELRVYEQLILRASENPYKERLSEYGSATAFKALMTERNAFLYTYSGDFLSLLILARLVYPVSPDVPEENWQPWEYTLYYNAPPGYLLFPDVPESRRTYPTGNTGIDTGEFGSKENYLITAPESFLQLITASQEVLAGESLPFVYSLDSYPINSIVSGNFGEGVLGASITFSPTLATKNATGYTAGTQNQDSRNQLSSTSFLSGGSNDQVSTSKNICTFSIAGKTYIIPTIPDGDISESYTGQYDSQTPLWWYENVNMYTGTASRTVSATFHLHQELWNTNPIHQGMESLISACIAGSYPTGTYTPRGTLTIGNSIRCSGLVACDVTRFGAIDENGYYMEASLTITITQESASALSANTFLGKTGSGGFI